MSLKKIFIIAVLLLGAYLLFFSPPENVTKIGQENNNDTGLDREFKRGELSKKYFDWLKNDLGVNDKKITQTYLEKFFNEVVPPQLNLPLTLDSEIKIVDSNKVNLKNYLEQTAKIKILPDEKNVDYVSIAQNADKTETAKILKQALEAINRAITQLKAVPVPPEAKQAHKKYVSLIKFMREMFNDLNYAQEDPIKINYNMALSSKVVQASDEITKEREKLANTLK